MTRRRRIPAGSWEKTINKNVPTLNSIIFKDINYTGIWDMPKLEAVTNIPEKFWCYSNISRWEPGYGTIYFYVEDVRFNALWTRCEASLPKVKSWGNCFTPDFSVYLDWPFMVNAWNIFRARALGAFWQANGVTVIPSLQWGNVNAMGSILWEGLPKKSVLAISTGHCNGLQEEEVFKNYYINMLAVLKPLHMLVYGRKFKGWLEDQDTPITRIDSDISLIYEHRRKLGDFNAKVDH